MSTNHYADHVVVGTDGSHAAGRALDVAGRAASLRKAPLTLLLSVAPPRLTATEFGSTELIDRMRERGEATVAQAAARVREAYPQLEVTTEVVIADAAAALVDATRSARLTVVGARGKNSSRTAQVLGGTSDIVITHAEGPVMVVPETADPMATGPAVVGVDASTDSTIALRLAFESAALRQVALVAVCVWDLNPADFEYFDAGGLDPLLQRVTETVEGVHADYPDVQVETKLLRGATAAVLLEESRHASLMVVGSRGLGGFVGLLLGSTSREVTRRAGCPVLVARHPRRGGSGKQA